MAREQDGEGGDHQLGAILVQEVGQDVVGVAFGAHRRILVVVSHSLLCGSTWNGLSALPFLEHVGQLVDGQAGVILVTLAAAPHADSVCCSGGVADVACHGD